MFFFFHECLLRFAGGNFFLQSGLDKESTALAALVSWRHDCEGLEMDCIQQVYSLSTTFQSVIQPCSWKLTFSITACLVSNEKLHALKRDSRGSMWWFLVSDVESCAFLWWWPRSPEPLYNFLSGCSFADKPVWIMNEATQQSSCVSLLLLVTSHLLNVSVIQALRIPRCIGERRRRTDKKCCWKVRHGFYRSVKRRYCVVGMCTQCVASAGLCDKLM